MPVGQQQNIGQIQVVDPILSRYVQGFKQANLVGSMLFPFAPVPAYQHTIITFGREAFKIYNSKRAMGSATKSIQTGRDTHPLAIELHSLEAKVPVEELAIAQSVGITGTQQRKIDTVMRAMMLELEYDQAVVARNAANYGANNKVALAGAARWSQAGGTPLDDIEVAKQAIEDEVGVEPNVMILGKSAWRHIRQHQSLKDQIKYTSPSSITLQILSSIVEMQNVAIGKGVYDDADGNKVSIWGDDVIIAYVPERAGTFDMEEPSYGYTYHPEGHPFVETGYQNNNTKTWNYPITFNRQVNLTAMDAGFLIQGAGDNS